MKKNLLLILSFAFFSLHAQEPCGFDKHQKELEERYPQERISREKFEAQLLATDVRSYLKKIGAAGQSSLYSGTIYEIPVVVHVIEPSATSSFASYTVTDAQIQTWIENTSKMYAATYSTFFAEGTGNYDGTVIPFKLVLAKRDPQCQATNGIVRISGSSNSNYDNYGVYSSSKGATSDEVRALSPHWNESSYFNIYVVTTFDANTTTYGLVGWAGLPTNSDAYYDSFMKVAVVKNLNSTTLAHEFGHGLGLYHPFGDANSQGGECPANTDCTTDNDKVCDTEPTQSLLNTAVYPLSLVVNQGNNTCTDATYQGVQYNVMNYTSRPQKFTPGQRERALAVFLQTRGGLVNSLGSTALSVDESISLTSPTCSPAGVTNNGNYGIGPTNVTLGTISNTSSHSSGEYYIDYSSMACLNKNFVTDLEVGKPYTLSIAYGTYPQWVKAWIDYNNNGTFESSELIANSNKFAAVASSPFTATITPPSDAVLDTYLRLRVRSDYGDYSACDVLAYGQVEDYAVRIISPTTSVASVKGNPNAFVAYNNTGNKLVLLGAGDQAFGQYSIYDLAGNLVKAGNSNTDEISFDKRAVSGSYILKFKLSGLLVSKKVVIF